jgi:hypothetical protein
MIKEVYFSPVIGAAMFVDFVELCHRHAACMAQYSNSGRSC